MNDVRMPIETIRDGNKITKICVEDVYKVINRVQEAMNVAYSKSVDIIDTIHKDYGDYEGELIIGTGISQPCLSDAFDEEIGNNIAFMKAKLNANIKKHNFLVRIYNSWIDCVDKLNEEIESIDSNIKRDLYGVRQHNPEYLNNIENKLGI
jgi:hypothetical protein